MELKIANRATYTGKISIKKYNITISFYTKKQIKSIYPNKNYRVVGEVGNKTGIQCGTADNLDGKPLPIYKESTHSRFTEGIVGYTAVDTNTYLAVVKKVLLRKVLILALIGAVAVIAINCVNLFCIFKAAQ